MRSSLLLPFVMAAAAGACAAPSEADDIESAESANTEATCPAFTETTPGNPSVFFAPFDAPEQQVLCLLSRAEREVVIAHYNIRRENVIAKLIELKNRGVDVKVAVDQTNAGHEWNVGDDAMQAAGIRVERVKPRGSGAIMHLKAAVIDGKIAMTGSFNWNETAALANDENMVVFKDPEVVSRFRNQVLEVLGDKPRAKEPVQAAPNVKVYFTPEQRVDDVIAAEIDRATRSVDVAMFTYTNATIGAAIERAARKPGVKVRLVLESKQTGMSSADEKAEAAGATVVRGGNRIGQYSAMHQKYAILDDERVITGATNWTNAGTRTNEEDLVVVDDAAFARKYRQNFADLMMIYGGVDVTADDPSALSTATAKVLFNPIHDGTGWGDRVVVVGSDPALGSWDPRRGVGASTHADMFPSWTAPAVLPSGAHVEYKYVTLRANGEIVWEPGPNRVLDVPATGRAQVTSGQYGDTGVNWTPRTPR